MILRSKYLCEWPSSWDLYIQTGVIAGDKKGKKCFLRLEVHSIGVNQLLSEEITTNKLFLFSTCLYNPQFSRNQLKKIHESESFNLCGKCFPAILPKSPFRRNLTLLVKIILIRRHHVWKTSREKQNNLIRISSKHYCLYIPPNEAKSTILINLASYKTQVIKFLLPSWSSIMYEAL